MTYEENDFSEKTRVQLPALLHLTRLGYKYISLKNQIVDRDTNIFEDIFKKSIIRLNPSADEREVSHALSDLKLTLTYDDLGEKFFEMITSNSGIKLIDLENFENNTLNIATELTYYGRNKTEFRVDIAIIINGLPLAFIEVKKPNNEHGIEAEHARAEKRFSNEAFKTFANLTQLMIFSNDMEYSPENSLQGAFYASSSYGKIMLNKFREEKQLTIPQSASLEVEKFILADNNKPESFIHNPEYNQNKSADRPTNRILTSLLSPDRFAFLLKYGIVYVKRNSPNGQKAEKHIMRYPQFFACQALVNSLESGKRGGIIWHTQGSGKTALAYFSTKVLTDYFAKKHIIPKFYFIVDRLDLLNQAKGEFLARGLHVNTVASKRDFVTSINSQKAYDNDSGKTEITVVNVHKFDENQEEQAPNDYSLNIQRIYFVDEAHRSYKKEGSFLKNLLLSDRQAIKIGLTGTPIVKGDISRQIFGDYIHKYYYNSSIEDGYTLRLIREDIKIPYKLKLNEQLNRLGIHRGEISKRDVFSHPQIAEPLIDFIVQDLQDTRLIHNDKTIGGMVVCDSSAQARTFFDTFKKNHPELKGQLILSSYENDDFRTQEKKKFVDGEIDILFVFQMLLTGFDAPRLKKLYLTRIIRDHNLLQTLTRVNRPYHNFKFGYVVDFAGIEDEFERTNQAYYRAFTGEMTPEDASGYSNFMKTQREIDSELAEVFATLDNFNTSNFELFSDELSAIHDKNRIRDLVKKLTHARELYNVAKISGATIQDKFSINQLITLQKIANDRLTFLNSSEGLQKGNYSDVIDTALTDAIFSVFKVGQQELRIGQAGEMEEQIKMAQTILDRIYGKSSNPELTTIASEIQRILLSLTGQDHLAQAHFTQTSQKVSQILATVRKHEAEQRQREQLYSGSVEFAKIHESLVPIFKATFAPEEFTGASREPSPQESAMVNFLRSIQNYTSQLRTNNEEIFRQHAQLRAKLEQRIINEFFTHYKELKDPRLLDEITNIITEELYKKG